MAVPNRDPASTSISDRSNETALVYANDVRVVAEPGGVRLVFTRTRPVGDTELGQAPSGEPGSSTEVIARLVVPPLAARRLLRLLPSRLDRQRLLAEAYADETERDAGVVNEHDPFLAALAAAEEDDEPFTNEERAAVQEGWNEYQRGETVPWEEVKRELLEGDEAAQVSRS